MDASPVLLDARVVLFPVATHVQLALIHIISVLQAVLPVRYHVPIVMVPLHVQHVKQLFTYQEAHAVVAYFRVRLALLIQHVRVV
jgi:hypothetical protein